MHSSFNQPILLWNRTNYGPTEGKKNQSRNSKTEIHRSIKRRKKNHELCCVWFVIAIELVVIQIKWINFDIKWCALFSFEEIQKIKNHTNRINEVIKRDSPRNFHNIEVSSSSSSSEFIATVCITVSSEWWLIYEEIKKSMLMNEI